MLPSTISESQGAFVVGRQILNQALMENEAIYRVRKKEGVLFNIDFDKAYDHVDWNLVVKVLERVLATNGDVGFGSA